MSGKTKTTNKVTPWDPASINAASGALKGAYGQAQGTIAQYSPALNSAIGQIQQNVAHPAQFVTDAQSQLDKTINGDYLNPSSNPYAAGLGQMIADKTQGNYNTTFGAAGRSHGGLAALLSGEGVGNALNSFYGGIYENERGRQQQATMAAPAFHQDQYTDTNALFNGVQGLTNLPLNAAATYAGATGGLLSPYTTQTQTQKQGFGLAQAIGLAAQIGGAIASGGATLPMMGASMAGGGGGGLLSMAGGGGLASGFLGMDGFGG